MMADDIILCSPLIFYHFKGDGIMHEIIEFFKRDRFAQKTGIEVLEVHPGQAKVRMKVTEDHLNGVNTVHGGALFTLADFAFALASNSYGKVSVAINANISYIKAARKGILLAEAKEVSKNPKLATYTVNIYNEEGEVIALFQGLAYRKKQKLRDIE